jgi:hypothetical protein
MYKPAKILKKVGINFELDLPPPSGMGLRACENIVPEIISKSIVILPFSIHNSFRHFE